jgi:CIC family chloride channel protein
METVKVKEVMSTKFTSVDKDMTLEELAHLFDYTHHHGMVVLDDHGKLWGIVSISDLEQALESHKSVSDTHVKEIATPLSTLFLTYPEETIGNALNKMSIQGVGRMLVVSYEDSTHLLGLIRRQDIIRAYKLGLTRHSFIQQRAQQLSTQDKDGMEFVNLELTEGDHAIGKTIKELGDLMPENCVFVSIKRNGALLIPHGYTLFERGDKITAFIKTEDRELLNNCLKG